MSSSKVCLSLAVAATLTAPVALGAVPLGTAFTYQGQLQDGGLPAEGPYDLQFQLYDDPSAGSQVGSTIQLEDQPVSKGLFSVQLDFGVGVFTGSALWLEVGARPGGETGAYTTLSPRQALTAAPYALYALGPWMSSGTSLWYSGGSVGIGTGSPTSPLTVNGVIESTSGGVKFPDGTVQVSALTGGALAGRNPLQIALLRWYGANQAGKTFTVGSGPWDVAFDGASIWVTNQGTNNVTKLRASDGAVLGTFDVGVDPIGVVFDGANVWVANSGSHNVTKVRASDGALLGTYACGWWPYGVAFDGANVWVTNSNSDTVTKLRSSDGAAQGTFNVGNGPAGVAFDGANVWVANYLGDNVTKLRASDGAVQGTFPVGIAPRGVAFDGANVWVANSGSDNVTKLRASDGAFLANPNVGTDPYGLAFDGTNIWVANSDSNNVTKLRAGDGALLGTYNVGGGPTGVAFDGANIRVTNYFSNTVSKL